MSKRTKFLLGIGVIAALVVGWQVVAFATSLPGSSFEIDNNANLKVDVPGNSDWLTVNEAKGVDATSGRTDDSYAGGAKEDDTCPGTTLGSIPNNKSDLKTFGAYVEPGTSPTDPGFLNLYWTRVQDPSGTTLMDFELNQSSTKCANGVNPVRTTGDLLIEYRIEQGGATATIKVRTWNGSAWGGATDLTAANLASGTINDTAILAGDSDIGALDPRTFGEAQLDLDFIFDQNTCESFGSAFVKSRSSDSFTSQLKDFIKPVPVNITNCGKVIIHKQTTPDGNTTSFNYTKNFNTNPATTNTFSLQDNGTKTFNGVLLANDKTVVETIPDNWTLSSIDCSAGNVTPDSTSTTTGTVQFDIDQSTDVLECTYNNTLNQGALRILKNSTKGGAVANAGAVFSFGPGATQNVTDNGTRDEDSDVGEVCVSGLSTGPYTVNETSPPNGYAGAPASEADQVVNVATGTNCAGNQPGTGATATFTNPPLSDIQVNFRDGGSDETSATISCDNTTGTGSNTAASGWDTSRTVTGVRAPTDIHCTISIDP